MYHTEFEDNFFKKRNPLGKLLRSSLEILEARETGILFGTNHTQLKFLPATYWDRGIIDKFDGRGIRGLVLKLFGKRIVTAKKLSPIYFYKKDRGPDQEEIKEENHGINAYILRNSADYYKKGISVFICPEISGYLQNLTHRYVYIPCYSYDGTRISLCHDKIKMDTQIVKHFSARNYLSVYLPDYGILTINTADEGLLKIENNRFVKESDLKRRLDILIKMVEAATLSSLGQLRGKAGAELLWRKEKHLRETSARLIENEKQFRNLYENAPVAYFSVDRNGIITRSNLLARKLSGYSQSQLSGMNVGRLLPDMDKIVEALQQETTKVHQEQRAQGNFQEKPRIKNMEVQIQRKDQTSIWLNLSIDTLLDPGGDIHEYRVAANDITLRKIAEAQIKKAREELEIRVEQRTAELKKEIEQRTVAEEKYRRLMEASPVPITVYDMEGNAVYINPAFTQTFGWCLEEIMGKKIDYVPKQELPQTLKMLERISKGKGFHGFETRRYTKEKELLDVSISFDVWRGSEGDLKGSVVILHDVTKRKQLEMQLFQSRKMEAIGTLAGGIAHDFNNILSGIFSYSQLAELHIYDTSRARGNIRQIVKGAKRAAELVQRILTFSRQRHSQKQPLQLSLVVADALTLLRSSIPSIIEIREEIDCSAQVMADATQIHQVVMNLCTNAYHAMREKGGTLTLRLKETDGSQTFDIQGQRLPAGPYLVLEVSDTGCGMSPQILEKAFDLYFTTKKADKGTGFGLAMVHSIVREHHGSVLVDSSPGQGTSFYVYLPVMEKAMVQDPMETKTICPAGGKEKIMVVDDEPVIRTGTQELLQDFGYQVTTYEDGSQAFEVFRKDPFRFDLIVTDMNMPKMTGEELSEKVLNLRGDMPIILCTGYSEFINREKTIEIGIAKYTQKPIIGAKLASLIREVLDECRSPSKDSDVTLLNDSQQRIDR